MSFLVVSNSLAKFPSKIWKAQNNITFSPFFPVLHIYYPGLCFVHAQNSIMLKKHVKEIIWPNQKIFSTSALCPLSIQMDNTFHHLSP